MSATPAPLGDDGRTALHYAALDDDTDGLHALLTAGADVDAADIDGAVALHCAAHNGALGALLVLLDAQPAVDAPDRNGNTPLMIAVTVSNGDTRLAAALLAAGADPRQDNHFHRSPVELARLLGHSRLHELLQRSDGG